MNSMFVSQSGTIKFNDVIVTMVGTDDNPRAHVAIGMLGIIIDAETLDTLIHELLVTQRQLDERKRKAEMEVTA